VSGWRRRTHRVTERLRAWRGYGRSTLWSWRGSQIGRRVVIEPGSRADRPWRIEIGERSRLERGVWLKLVADEARLTIGSHVFIGAWSELDVLLRLEIGDHALIGPGCFITDHNHGKAARLCIDKQACVPSPVRIGSDVWIGAGSIILPGVEIGDGAIVGAGAVATRRVLPYDIVAGVPARVIGHRK